MTDEPKPTLDELIACYEERCRVHAEAQRGEIAARHALHVASGSLHDALKAHVRRFFVPDQLLMTRAHGEIKIVDIRVPLYNLPQVQPVFHQRIQSGKWGKTRTSSDMVVWDFERNRWRSRLRRDGRLIWEDEAFAA